MKKIIALILALLCGGASYGIIGLGVGGYVEGGEGILLGETVSSEKLRLIWSAVMSILPMIGTALFPKYWPILKRILDAFNLVKMKMKQPEVDGLLINTNQAGQFFAEKGCKKGVKMASELHQYILETCMGPEITDSSKHEVK